MAVYTPQNNMVFATLQEDLTDDGAETPSLTPSYIRLTEAKTAEMPAGGYVIVAGDSRRVPDDTEWAMYEYTGKGDQSANGTDDSLTNLARAVSNNRSFTSSHTFTGGSADVVLVNSADQFNDLLAIFNGNANWPAGQNAGGNSLTNLFAVLGSAQSSAPDNPSPGDYYMDDGTNTEDGYAGLRQFTNGSWEDVGAGGGGSNAFSFFMG